MIAPSHGTIWRVNPLQIVEKYAAWANAYQEDQVTIAYDTMWEGTTRIAHKIAEEIHRQSPNTVVNRKRPQTLQPVILTDLPSISAVHADIFLIRRRVIPTVESHLGRPLKICRMTGAVRFAASARICLKKWSDHMKNECKITVIDKKCFTDYQEQYLADPKSGPCPFFNVGDTFLLKRTPQQDDFYHLMNGKFCGEAWDAVSRYVYAALQGGSIMKGWTNDDRMMIACCNDGTRPVIFKIERIDIPENAEEEAWLAKQDFHNSADKAYTG